MQLEWEVFHKGDFMMGSEATETGRDPDENPHWVSFTNDFALSKTELSQELYHFVMGDNPSEFFGSQNPVENITWFEAIEFCNQLSLLDRRQPVYQIDNEHIVFHTKHNGYRLPTEAEWEYAAKQTLSKYPQLQHPPKTNWRTHRIQEDTKQWMSALMGNVWEMCWDWYGEYDIKDSSNPIGPKNGRYRVIRGGSWVDSGRIFRPANRSFVDPNQPSSTIGFRLAQNHPFTTHNLTKSLNE